MMLAVSFSYRGIQLLLPRDATAGFNFSARDLSCSPFHPPTNQARRASQVPLAPGRLRLPSACRRALYGSRPDDERFRTSDL